MTFCLVDKKYNNSWICRKLLWENGSGRSKEIHIYDLSAGLKLISKIREANVVSTLRLKYPNLSIIPTEQLLIQNIFVTPSNNLGLCLKFGIFI